MSSEDDIITLEKLAQKSPNLQTLSVNIYLTPVESKSMEFRFRNLQNVTFRVRLGCLPLVSSYLHMLVQTTSLRSLHLYYPGLSIIWDIQNVDNSVLKGLIEALSSFRYLQELAISISPFHAEVVNPDSAHLDPLMHLTRLESVSFTGVDFGLTDAVIQRLISVWGNLKKFRFVHYSDRTSQVSLAVLRSFAAYTPKLEDLRVNLDATCVPPRDHGSVTASVLPVHIDFGCSPIQMFGSSRQVAKYIADIYPHAILQFHPDNPCYLKGCKCDYRDMWKQVGETIATFSGNPLPKFQD
ncbi:hypothetical protein PHLCEN_2v864 [Hermanssonia centrifuga]|uniref:Uncharacterized protein n=1 Tax=Hermanssonia centrifuga TaxID=98765 RepID=A0A2R6S4W8_9APHY|nr:hypothetical protein PHLCEN_2v864 [Hermanssonia centrifuga]